MKFFSILLVCAAAAAAFMPAQAQSRRSRAARTVTSSTSSSSAATAPAEPKTGVRFVVCSPAGIDFPSPLYVRSGKEFKAIHIGARTPSPRVKPVNGVVEFWEENPNPEASADDPAAAKKAVKLPPPVFSVNVPSNAGSKSVCILSPNKEVKKTATVFFNEKDFPRKGMHIVNLSSYPLVMTTWEKSDFSDKVETKIGVYRRDKGICSENSWKFVGKKNQQVSFILSYMEKGAKMPKRIKASAFSVSDRQSIVNIIVKDPGLNRPKLITIQLADDTDDSKE